MNYTDEIIACTEQPRRVLRSRIIHAHGFLEVSQELKAEYTAQPKINVLSRPETGNGKSLRAGRTSSGV